MVLLVSVATCLGALALSAYTLMRQGSFLDDERAARRAEVSKLHDELAALRGNGASLAGRVTSAEKELTARQPGVASLAARVLRSVFTVRTDFGLGSGFVAWRDGDSTYLLTADHVVAGQLHAEVTLSRRDGSWVGEIAARDGADDLALIRLDGRPAGAEPLWQRSYRKPPRQGDELLLVGSPFGLVGTITTGVVSRVTKTAIQTDAAANPGNSGGPAIDREGRVVGVLVSGGGENINFAVPIALACARLRSC